MFLLFLAPVTLTIRWLRLGRFTCRRGRWWWWWWRVWWWGIRLYSSGFIQIHLICHVCYFWSLFLLDTGRCRRCHKQILLKIVNGELYPMIFKRICRILHFVIFIKILEYRYIAKLLPLNTVAHNCCISGCFKSLWRSIRGRVIVSRVNRTVLKIYVTKPYQFEPTFAIHREKKQRKKKKEVLLYYVISSKNIGWHPNSASRCWDPDLLMKFFF